HRLTGRARLTRSVGGGHAAPSLRLVSARTAPTPAQTSKSGRVLTIHSLTAPPSLRPHEELLIVGISRAAAGTLLGCIKPIVMISLALRHGRLTACHPRHSVARSSNFPSGR